MKYLFIGGAHDGKHLEVADNTMSTATDVAEKIRSKTTVIGQDIYTRRLVQFTADLGALNVFALASIPDKQIMWRLVSGYKANA